MRQHLAFQMLLAKGYSRAHASRVGLPCADTQKQTRIPRTKEAIPRRQPGWKLRKRSLLLRARVGAGGRRARWASKRSSLSSIGPTSEFPRWLLRGFLHLAPYRVTCECRTDIYPHGWTGLTGERGLHARVDVEGLGCRCAVPVDASCPVCGRDVGAARGKDALSMAVYRQRQPETETETDRDREGGGRVWQVGAAQTPQTPRPRAYALSPTPRALNCQA